MSKSPNRMASGEPVDFYVRIVDGLVAFEVKTGDGGIYTVYLRRHIAMRLANAIVAEVQRTQPPLPAEKEPTR